MNKILSNIYLFPFLAICAVCLSLVASYTTRNWDWFARSGSIVTMVGIILSVRPILRMGVAKYIEEQKTQDNGSILGDTPKEIVEDRQLKLDVLGLYIGNFMTVVGTLIWGYGDLLG